MGLFGGSESSSAQGQSSAAINSSGWVVGNGDASGGQLSQAFGGSLPWYAWASVAAVGAAYIYYKRKKRGK